MERHRLSVGGRPEGGLSRISISVPFVTEVIPRWYWGLSEILQKCCCSPLYFTYSESNRAPGVSVFWSWFPTCKKLSIQLDQLTFPTSGNAFSKHWFYKEKWPPQTLNLAFEEIISLCKTNVCWTRFATPEIHNFLIRKVCISGVAKRVQQTRILQSEMTSSNVKFNVWGGNFAL